MYGSIECYCGLIIHVVFYVIMLIFCIIFCNTISVVCYHPLKFHIVF